MNTTLTSARARMLSRKIREANVAYYNEQPSISDAQYDALRDELKEIDPENTVLSEVGASTSGAWQDRKHSIPMSSLNKVNTIAELQGWAAKLGTHTFMVQEKLDGISVSLDYVEGRLVAGVTRGDGIVGEDITPNVLKMQGIKTQLADSFTGSVRGEIVLFKKDWEEHFSDMANPRNAASGLSRRQSGSGQNHLHVLCYDIVGNITFLQESDKISALAHMGFLVPNWHGAKAIEDVAEIYSQYESEGRDALPYEIDGLVIKLESLQRQVSLGKAGDRENANPKGQVALKFSHEMRQTTVNNIIWETGKSGRVTPVAQVEAVRIAGVTIRNASLHNLDNIRKLQVRVGSEVLLSRRNDVIPYIEEVTANPGEYTDVPTACPTCDTRLLTRGKYIQCENDTCPSRMIGGVEKWLSNLEVDGWGPKVIEALHDAGKLNYISDLYLLQENDISELEGHGPRSAEVLLGNLNAKKNVPLHIALGSLNISGCGRRVFQTIVRAGNSSLASVQALTPAALERIDGIGPVLAKDVHTGLQYYRAILDRLLASGVNIVDAEVVNGGPLSGKSFCCTGSMVTPRKELIKMIETNGGEWSSSVKNGLDYLIIDDIASTTTKATKAKQLGTKLISESQFNSMLAS